MAVLVTLPKKRVVPLLMFMVSVYCMKLVLDYSFLLVDVVRSPVPRAVDDSSSNDVMQIGCRFTSTTPPNKTAAINDTNSGTVARFHAESFACRQEVSDRHVVFVDFLLLECPPQYHASTFQLQASTANSRMMGHVGPRHAVKDGCGIYNASVAFVPSKNVSIELFWTSNHLHYSNHVSDIVMAHDIKGGKYSGKNLTNVLTTERLAYLESHLTPIQGFPINISLDKTTQSAERQLPDCATVPIRQWAPVGVVKKGSRERFMSARCVFPIRILEELNTHLAGIRIKFLLDSHGANIMTWWQNLTCPEITNANDFFELGYECPNRTNSFQVAYRFFRGVHHDVHRLDDFDGISAAMRRGDVAICRTVLGLGLYNVTIIGTPTWLFVYETQEGLNDYIVSIKSMLENCKTAFPDLFSNHIVLVQSAFARDSLDYHYEQRKDEDVVPWRGIHNYQIESFTESMAHQLDSYVDGIIPAFELTYAVTVRTFDGVHWDVQSPVYEQSMQLQATAVISAVRSRSKGTKHAVKKHDNDANVRWFVGVDLE